MAKIKKKLQDFDQLQLSTADQIFINNLLGKPEFQKLLEHYNFITYSHSSFYVFPNREYSISTFGFIRIKGWLEDKKLNTLITKLFSYYGNKSNDHQITYKRTSEYLTIHRLTLGGHFKLNDNQINENV